MVLDDLWVVVHGWARACRNGIRHRSNGAAGGTQADERRNQALAFARSRQADARVPDDLGLLCVLAVADHLGGKSSGRDSVLHAADSVFVEVRWHRADRFALLFA